MTLPESIAMAKGTTVGSHAENLREQWRASFSKEAGAVPEERAQGCKTKTTDVSPPTPTLST